MHDLSLAYLGSLPWLPLPLVQPYLVASGKFSWLSCARVSILWLKANIASSGQQTGESQT